ncbi:MAG: hypothetical protein AAGC77_10345, partial [Pseudomonadota bacterium]
MAQKKILLKTTIGEIEDDWHIGRFSVLANHLKSLGHKVTTLNRREQNGDDIDLAGLAASDFDQLWIFAVDVEDALTAVDAEHIDAFRARGGGVLITRDHEDMGDCLLKLGELGMAHHFHSNNCEPDAARHQIDDKVTTNISWPNYHTGANGDYQTVETPNPMHPLVLRDDGTPLAYLPAHPHEGVVSVPDGAGAFAEEIIRGKSIITGNSFGAAVAFSGQLGDNGGPL